MYLIIQKIQVAVLISNLVLLSIVGTFGRIYHGVLIGEDENDIESEQDVFIKTVTGQSFYHT